MEKGDVHSEPVGPTPRGPRCRFFVPGYMDPASCMAGSWHCVAGVTGFFVAKVLFWVALLATGELFISLMRVTRRVKPWSRAALLAGEASGASPARMKPWPAPS